MAVPGRVAGVFARGVRVGGGGEATDRRPRVKQLLTSTRSRAGRLSAPRGTQMVYRWRVTCSFESI